MIWTYVLLFAALLVLIGVIVFFLIVWLREKKTPSDDCLILNLCSHLDKSGRALLSEKDIKSTSYNDRHIIVGTPRDIDYGKVLKNKETVTDVKTIAEESKIIPIAKGTWSKDKNIKIILPPNAEDIPEAIKNTPIGIILAQLTEDKNVEKTILNIIRTGSDLKTQYLNKMSDGEVSMELIDEYEKIFSHIKELLERKQQSSPYMPSPMQQ